MLRNQDLTLAHIQNLPGGFQHLTSVFNSMNNASVAGSDPSTEEANRLMASRLGVSPTLPSDGPNSQALPNPWATPSSSPLGTPISTLPFGNLGGFSPVGIHAPTASPSTQNAPMSNQMNPSNLLNSAMNGSQHFPPLYPTQTSGMNPFYATANPIPSAQNSFLMLQQLMQANPMNTTPAVSEPVEVRYREQLQVLRDMGFTNEEQNKRAILAAV
jgi:ubiquilin